MDGNNKDKNRKLVGHLGEGVACLFLQKKGFVIVERNFREPWGEIDIVALKNGSIRFVEVKAVSVPDFSREMDHRPEELVDARKLRKMERTAVLYMEKKKDSREFQLDVVGVLLNHKTRTARCRLFEQVLGE